MPDDAIFAADSAEHRGAHLARERALWLPKAILRAVRDRRALERGSNRLEICERRQERDIGFGYERLGAGSKRVDVCPRLVRRLEALPVGGEKRSVGHAVFAVRSAATPGRSLPSIYSSVAPPPVDICVILSAKPSLCAAAAESPPPTTEIAPESTIA